MTKQKTEIWVLVGLAAIGALVYWFNRSTVGSVPGVSADVRFSPLSVQEPQLRLDLLAKLQKETNIGSHRNIFNATPPPPELTPQQIAEAKTKVTTGPMPPAPPPPVQVPGEFFGTAFRPMSGKHFAFFKNGDDVIIVAEGDPFLGNYRLIHIGNDSADVEEISSGRHARIAMVQPATGGGGGGASIGGDDPNSQR
ncbi:MAG: hypothetical protein ACRD59_04435 [Candidatus Acidiferrales bacterium]